MIHQGPYITVYIYTEHCVIIQVFCGLTANTLLLILIVNWQESGQTEYHAIVMPIIRFRLRRSNSVFLQLQFEAFYTVNLLNTKWKVVPARNSGWKKSTSMNHNLPGGV